MTTVPLAFNRSWNGRHLKIEAVKPEDRKRKIQEKIAKRAYKLSEVRAFEPGHTHEDWRRAESEIVGPLNCGYLLFDRGLELRTDAACFGEGTIEIYAEPKRLTLFGRSHSCAGDAALGQAGEKPAAHSIVRSIELPFEIEPSEASAKFNGRMIVVYLPRVSQKLAASAAA